MLKDFIYLKCNAKLNLFLKINGINPNNYHDMTMINQSVSLFDEIYIKKNNNNEINVFVDNINIIKEDNLVYKTAQILKKIDNRISVDIKLNKNIPMQAGLGGGSSDAAGIILGLNELYKMNLTENEMIDIAVSIGADVPFCLFGGSKLVYGIGEKIKNIDSDKFLFLVIKPNENVSTKEAFRLFDKNIKINEEDININNIITSNQKIDMEIIRGNFYNNFEKVMLDEIPEIRKAKNDLYENKAVFSMMSGSGSTVFGIFENETFRKEAYEKLKKIYNNIYICETTDVGINIIK